MGIDSAWRWRRGVEDLYHYRFWGQVARWMSYQRNMAAGKRVRLYFNPERPVPGDSVTLNANAFDPNGAPLQEGTVIIDLTAPDGNSRRFELTSTDAAWGAFTGRFNVDPARRLETHRPHRRLDPDSAVETTLLAQGTQLEKTGQPGPPGCPRGARQGLPRPPPPARPARRTPEGNPAPCPSPAPSSIPHPLWSHWIARRRPHRPPLHLLGRPQTQRHVLTCSGGP